MAEATALRNNVLDFPVYGCSYTIVVPMLDADGDLVTGATTPDSEISKNGDTFADCTNEATEIATNSGMYYLTLTATEMTADVVAVIVKSATAGMKTTPIVLYPVKLPKLIDQDVTGATGNDSTHIHIDAGVATDDYYNGCFVYLTAHTGADQGRLITDYVGSTKLATVSPAFATTPDNTTDYDVYATPLRPMLSAVINDKTGYSLSAAGIDSIIDEVIEGTHTLRQMLRIFASALAAKVSGGGTATITFRDIDDTKNRIVATVDSNGNRTAITLTET
jgi:hypothetical protein